VGQPTPRVPPYLLWVALPFFKGDKMINFDSRVLVKRVDRFLDLIERHVAVLEGDKDSSKCDSCINGGDECEFNPDNFPVIRWCDNYVKE